jgi:hypothetical protein
VIHHEFSALVGIRLWTSPAKAPHHQIPPCDGVFVGLLSPGRFDLSQGSYPLDDLLVYALPAQKFRNLAPNLGATTAVFSCNRSKH